jgi:DNA-binding NtrC family response regulator
LAGAILIVDDEPSLGRALQRTLEANGQRAFYFEEPEAALAALRARPFDVLLTDLVMPGIDGLELIDRARRIRPGCDVVVMTAFATVDTARAAMKRGVVDYLTKPFSAERELLPLIRTLLTASEGSEGEGDAALASPEVALGGVVGTSPAMAAILDKLPRIARSGAGVLLRGESGTGKEVIATALHRLSERASAPFVKVNCAALPESLLEAELFGVAKGAYTGADADRPGLFQAADGGTLLLDEVGELPTATQAKLLRVLQDGEFRRIGDPRHARRVDVRVIASTNRDLDEAVRSGSFRKDLYYRLNVVPLVLPPLRERCDDLPTLVESLLARLAPGRRVRVRGRAWALFARYEWPGNVRELRNALEHALVLGDGLEIRAEDLPAAVQDAAAPARSTAAACATLEEIERGTIAQALTKTGFNRTRAARLLGITRRTLGYRIRKYGLEEQFEGTRAVGVGGRT